MTQIIKTMCKLIEYTFIIPERQQVHPPQFIERLQSFTVKENNTVTLSCSAVGFPLPMMSWQKDGRMLSNKEYK